MGLLRVLCAAGVLRMKQIKIKKGCYAYIDDEDFEYLNRFKWGITNGHISRQCGTAGKNAVVLYMEFFIKDKESNDRYFFVDGNPRNLQKENIEVRSYSNHAIGLRKTSRPTTSKYKGVSYDTRSGKWLANLWKTENGKKVRKLHSLFEMEDQAARAYNIMAYEVYGEMAYQNQL